MANPPFQPVRETILEDGQIITRLYYPGQDAPEAPRTKNGPPKRVKVPEAVPTPQKGVRRTKSARSAEVWRQYWQNKHLTEDN